VVIDTLAAHLAAYPPTADALIADEPRAVDLPALEATAE